ncbi:kinetochore protein NDC80 homolog [Homalodisca vitripennis]|uniref:kinetochore protein NDC80 homolog n=1 Tax=Homalodisca vitripennis TaxID=197043 RepID=UPI001EEC4E58|nr:kinetochore protein NDC80 homolog [Homalodisca vitripennis]
MRKSSLGRRSSTHIPVRVPSLGASGQRTCSGGKKSVSQMKQPGFSQRGRSQSEERESYGGRATIGGLVRSNTAGALAPRSLGAMTPITPRQSIHSNLPTGSARVPRNQTMSTDSNRRMSSFGGTKNARKDPRPISEKAFQQMAQARVQQYFDTYGLEVIGPGNSIRRMNTKLFVDMMDHMLKKIDSRIVLTKTNFLEDLPLLLRKLGYRSKVDRSWLMTVNTSHSWQHVIGVLSWLVDILECVSSVEPFDMMIGNNLNDDEPNEEENAEDFPIDKDVIHHLKKSYRYKDDPMAEEIVDRMDSEYIDKMITDFKCTDEDFEVLEREIELKREEVDGEAQRKDAQLEMIEKLKIKRDALQNDCQNNEVFIEESNVFIRTTEAKLLALEQEITLKRTFVSKKQEELFKLQEKVSNQQISVHEKDKIAKEKHDLQRMIIFYENGIREYENSVFAVDLKSAETQRKLEKSIVEYNKIVAEKIIVEPRLKNVEVKFTLLSEKNSQEMDIIDGNLKTLKEEYKNSIFELKSKKEELENILWQVKQDQKETKEEIAKECAFIEGIECDIEKQEESINKESQKLKEELSRYQKMIKEILEEIFTL